MVQKGLNPGSTMHSATMGLIISYHRHDFEHWSEYQKFRYYNRWEISVTGIVLIPFRKDTNILIEKINLIRFFETYIKLWSVYWNDNCWGEYGNHRWWIINRLVLTLLVGFKVYSEKK